MNLCVLFGPEFAFKFGAVRWAQDEFAPPLVLHRVSVIHPSGGPSSVMLFRAIRPAAALRFAKQLHRLGDLLLQDRVHLDTPLTAESVQLRFQTATISRKAPS